jgi:hypothetical protein
MPGVTFFYHTIFGKKVKPNEPVQKSVAFAQALAVSQAKALRNVHF